MAKRIPIKIERKNEEDDWCDFLSTRAEVSGLSGNAYWEIGAEQASTIKNFRVSYAKLLAECIPQEIRVRYKGMIYDVSQIDDFEERHKELVLRTEARYGR